jgi:hypothetical protein
MSETAVHDDSFSSAETMAALEMRLRKVEEDVTSLRDTHALEDRVVQRVCERLPLQAAPTARPITQADLTAAAAEAAIRTAGPTWAPRLAGAPWLIVDLGREIRAIFRMFFDLHYRVAWTTRVLTVVLVPTILLSQWLPPFSWLYGPGQVLDKIFDLALAMIVCKALSREAKRYMESKRI